MIILIDLEDLLIDLAEALLRAELDADTTAVLTKMLLDIAALAYFGEFRVAADELKKLVIDFPQLRAWHEDAALDMVEGLREYDEALRFVNN